jgi:hypothetical protein
MHDRHAVGKMSGGSGSERDDGSEWTVSLVVQPLSTIMTRQRQFLGLRHPCKMVSLSRVTLQPIL